MTDESNRFVYFTKKIRIPRHAIIGVKRSQFGPEAVIETDRGLTTVNETYDEVRHFLYGELVSMRNDDDAE